MDDFFHFSKKFGFRVFLVHPTVVLVLLSASVERCFVSRMRDFLLQVCPPKFLLFPLLVLGPSGPGVSFAQFQLIRTDGANENSLPCAVQYSTVQYSTVQYSKVQYSTVQYKSIKELDKHQRTISGMSYDLMTGQDRAM